MKKQRYAVFLILCVPASAWSIDLMPGEVMPLSAGTDFIQISALETKREGLYINGDLVDSTCKLSAQQWLLRYGRFDTVLNLPTYFHIEAPFLSIDTKGRLDGKSANNGVGDASIAFGVWPYADFDKKHYWALGGYIVFPSGHYESEKIYNPGSNRYSAAIQTAYQMNITPAITWLSAVDSFWFGNNHDFGRYSMELEQRPLLTLQTGVRLYLSKLFSISASFIKSTGGESRVSDGSWSEQQSIRRYQLGFYQSFKKDSVSLHYGGDIKTEQGLLEESRWIIRWTHLL